MSFYDICRFCHVFMEEKHDDDEGKILVCPKCGRHKEIEKREG